MHNVVKGLRFAGILIKAMVRRGGLTPRAVRAAKLEFRLRGVPHGERILVGKNVQISNRANLHVGSDVMLTANIFISCAAPVTIGDRVMIGPGTIIHATSHHLDSKRPFHKPITIEENVWIAASVTITCGVRIGHDSVIAAGAVVTKDIPPGVVAAGVPARVIKTIENFQHNRFEDPDWIRGF